MRGTATHDRIVLAGAALFFAAHLGWLTRHLEDIDSINFALGLRQYDIAAHQPHPPGYPVFIVLGRTVAALLGPWVPDEATRAAVAMALLSALAGALALLALYRVLVVLEQPAGDGVQQSVASSASDGRVASAWPMLAVLATAAAPLFWLTAARPLSDMSGLGGALGAQWLILRAARVGTRLRDAVVAAVACGLAVGLRSQVTWLVVPLLAWLAIVVWRRGGVKSAITLAAAALAGVLIWAIPMVAITGGPAAYQAAFVSQASEDLEGVPMLAFQPTPRRLITAALDTFVAPWGGWTLAAAVSILALVGVLSLRRHRTHARWLLLGALPYAVYHLLFQETETTRYALPFVAPTIVLVVLGARRWPRVLRPLLVVIALVSLGTAVTAHRQYVTTPVSVDDALRRLESSATDASDAPQVLMHRRVWAETRRARAALAPRPTFAVLPAPRSLEWKEALPAWQAGRPVWWLVDPRRGDTVAVDPRSRQLEARMAWPDPAAMLLGGMRPHAFDWYMVSSPQWVLGDGWGLTPELAGLAAAAGQGPSTTGTTAFLSPGASASGARDHSLVVGGRHVAAAGAGTVTLTVSVEAGTTSWQQQVTVAPGPFVFTWQVPATAIAGPATLTVRAARPAAGPEVIFLEQFDWQPMPVPVVALEAGWYEPERDTTTGRQWRWVGDRSELRVQPADAGIRLQVTGTYPRHYDREPTLEVRTGDVVIGRYPLPRPFSLEIPVTAAQLATSSGRLSWRISESFVAGERTGTADARRLALEIATLRAQAVR
ncbi:MAG TPA: DUF2723 domain-containing protein [Luteitalea sp.]|nr:DUF2723 domain-containing protein [Luteitalea sp.]